MVAKSLNVAPRRIEEMEEAVRAAMKSSTCISFYLNEIDVEYASRR